eukprot:6836144-Ditylum_brightwellii.AAC.1
MNETDDNNDNNDNSKFMPDKASLAIEENNPHYDDDASVRRDVDNSIPTRQDEHGTNAPDEGVNEHHLENEDTQQSNTEDDNNFKTIDRSQEEPDKIPNKEMAGAPTNNTNIDTTDKDTTGVVQNEDVVLQEEEENTPQAEINDRGIV